jgi:SAM-dependent methyltransferase
VTGDDEAADVPSSAQLWEDHAQWWIDGFTGGADPEYDEQILPLAGAELAGSTRVLDIGCGEGQISRLAARLDGVELVAGVDPTWNQISVAAERGGAAYARAVAHALPFPDGTFDVIASLNLLQEVSAPTVVLEEVRRLLKPGGSFRGVATCYAGDNAAEMVHQAVARRYTWYFLPADELLAQFHRVFPTGIGYFEPSARATRTQAAGVPTFTLFAEMIRKVQELGHNPEDVRLGALFLEGKKG